MWLFSLLPLLVAASRRLSADPCAHVAFVLAQGAPLSGGRVFPTQRKRISATVDDTGVGTRFVSKMPECQRATAMSLKIMDETGLVNAIHWLTEECAHKECVVYTRYDLPDGPYKVS